MWRLKGYIYIIYTPNLGFEIAVSVREREQGRFRGSNEGARGRSKGAPGEHGGARGSIEGALREHGGTPREQREHNGAVQGRSRLGPKMGPPAFGWSFPYSD